MQHKKRKHERTPVNYEVVFYWEDAAGQVHSIRPRAHDASDGGMCVESSMPIEIGTEVCVEAPTYGSALLASVRYCVKGGAGFRIGIEFTSGAHRPSAEMDSGADYYEILQLSPRADMETIHRVYRIMAARFHPDNPDSGDHERFLLLLEAYRVLSDPEKRAKYDTLHNAARPTPLPLFQAKAFIDQKEGESNRRLGILCLLYAQRRRFPEHPSIALMELEALMSIPREYLEFGLWYLKQKRFIEMNEGADFSITANGVDFVEEHTEARELLHRLLTAGESKQPVV